MRLLDIEHIQSPNYVRDYLWGRGSSGSVGKWQCLQALRFIDINIISDVYSEIKDVLGKEVYK